MKLYYTFGKLFIHLLMYSSNHHPMGNVSGMNHMVGIRILDIKECYELFKSPCHSTSNFAFAKLTRIFIFLGTDIFWISISFQLGES